MGIIELTVGSCIHLVRGVSPNFLYPSLASGVIVRYRKHYFICSVEHFTRRAGTSVGIVTGRKQNETTEIYELGAFSYLSELRLPLDYELDEEDFVCFIEDENNGEFLDVSFREISLVENIVQHEGVFDLGPEIGEMKVHNGGKSYLIVDEDFEIDPEERYSFFGRIRPDFTSGILQFQEALYWNLPMKGISEFFVELELGSPILDPTRFRGCSGAPILDTHGRLVALVTHGYKDLKASSIFGFRFDKIKRWIDLMYFQHDI